MSSAAIQTQGLSLTSHRDGDGTLVLVLAGRLDVDGAGKIWQAARSLLPGSGAARLELSGLDYADTAGMTLIHDLHHRQQQGGGSLEIHGLPAHLEQFFALTRLDDCLADIPEAPACMSLPCVVGMRTEQLTRDLGSMLTYIGSTASGLFYALLHPHRVRWQQVWEACTQVGAFALPVVALIGFLLGWVLAFSSAFLMKDFGADNFLGAMIGPAMVRELGPLMTCIVLAARSGSAFAAEIGTMKVNEEIDALSTMGVHPVRFLVTPKILAMLFMAPLLAIFANLMGIFGGGLVSLFILDQPLSVYTNMLETYVDIPGVLLGLSKAVIFGLIVGAIGCIRGLQAERNPAAVGEATTRAVVSSIVFIAISDAIIAVIVQILDI